MTTIEYLQARRQDVLQVARRQGITPIRVFGSVARGILQGIGRLVMLREWTFILVSLALLGGCGSDSPSGPGHTLEGDWSLISYADHGVVATASGTAAFGADGKFTITGELTFTGEPVETLNVAGTWSMTGDRAILTTSDGAGEWVVSFSGAEATLTRVGPAPTNVIGLRR